MRVTVLQVLATWRAKLAAQDEALERGALDRRENDVWLDRHLVGVARFLKEVGHKENDVELLGLATKAEIDLSERFASARKSYQMHQEDLERENDFYEDIRELCRSLFYEQRSFRVDSSRWRQMLDERAAEIGEVGEIGQLRAYIDEKRILNDVYYGTLKAVSAHPPGEVPATLPSFDGIKAAFERTYARACGRADKHVGAKLAKLMTRGTRGVAAGRSVDNGQKEP
jgi:hypothetical protein